MVALNPPVCDFGRKAVDFDLPATDGRRFDLESVRAPREQIPSIGCSIKWRN